MIKNINKFLYAGGLAVMLLGSCSKDFITKNPTTSLGTDQALTDVASMQTALNGAYAQLRSTSLFGRDFPVTGDLMADNTFIETNNSGRYLAQFNYGITNNESVFSGNWSAAYTGILYVNNIIDAEIPGAEEIKAQAYAIRALLYFKLLNIYARPYTDNPQALGVPLVLHYDPTALPTRETVGNVYAQIVSDLKAALQNAPAYASSVKLSKYSIQALLARTYFYMGDYANAKAAAVDVIENGGFTLANTAAKYKAFWDNGAIQTDKNEVLFEVDVDAVNNNSSNDLGAMYNGGYTDIYATKDLVESYSATDIRKAVILSGTTKSGIPANLVNKYPNYNNSDKDNLKVIRLAELYLIAAESSLSTNEADAKKYLNELMSFRDPSFGGYTSSGDQLLKDIVNERRKELAFEGDRFYDLNRLKWDIERGAQNAGSIPQGLATIPYSNDKRIAPIPLSEIQANANIKPQQNPGY
jgi:hypothetical protein